MDRLQFLFIVPRRITTCLSYIQYQNLGGFLCNIYDIFFESRLCFMLDGNQPVCHSCPNIPRVYA